MMGVQPEIDRAKLDKLYQFIHCKGKSGMALRP